MDTQRWLRAGDIFEQIFGKPAAERPRLADELCGDDAELRAIIASMLDAEGSAQAFEQVAAAIVQRNTSTMASDSATENLRIGPWRLVRRLGDGGMGVVWLAERADGQFEQRAALKLIKRGMDSEAVLARFLRERQILARLTHAHIAHLLDGGIAADGRPYFAMEFIDGLPLLHWCHEHDTRLEDRLRLFLDICSAVQFAHNHHVVHRDLKPSNVLVTASGDVKLLDFGIAKLLADTGVGEATITRHERPMSPAYAAPEQFRGEQITAATDIYALGAVLYQLLTEKYAYDFHGASVPADMQRIIEASDPVAPSRLRLSAPPVPPKRLRGDLDTIVLTALKHEPQRRYPSVAALADDLRNYLAGKPIAARRDHVLHRAWKFVRRHRVGVAATLAVGLVSAIAAYESRTREAISPLASGNAIAVVDFNNLSQDKNSAWLAPALAEMLATELASGGKVHVLPDELVRPARSDLPTPLAGGYGEQSLATLRKRLSADYVLSGSYLVAGAGDDARLRLDLALQDTRTGKALVNVAQSGALMDLPAVVEKIGASLRGQSGFAPAHLSREESTEKAQPPNAEVARHMGLALDALNKSDPARAKDELLDAIALAPGYAPAYLRLAQAWKQLGYDGKALAAAQQAVANSDGLPAEQRLRIERELAAQQSDWARALALDDRLLAADAGNPETHIARIDDLLGAGKADAAAAALAQWRKLPGSEADPRVELEEVYIADKRADYKAQLAHAELALRLAQARDEIALAANARYDIARAQFSLGSEAEAEKQIRLAIAAYQRIDNSYFEADARLVLAVLQAAQSRYQDARDEYQRVLVIYQRIGNRRGIALVQWNLAEILRTQGDRDAMQVAAQRTLGLSREIDDTRSQIWAQTALAQIKLDDGASDAALDDFRSVLALTGQAAARDQQLDVLVGYAEALRLRGQLNEAEQVCERARNEAKQLDSPYYQMRAEFGCAAIAFDRGSAQAALTAFQNSQATATQLQNVEYGADTLLRLAQIDRAEGKAEPACAKARQALDQYTSIGMVTGQANAQGVLAQCYDDLRKPDERDRALAQARDLRKRVTFRGQVAAADLALAELGEAPGRNVTNLLALADDLDRRYCVSAALDARLTALRRLEQDAKNAAGAERVRGQIRDAASAHGFVWILSQLGARSVLR